MRRELLRIEPTEENLALARRVFLDPTIEKTLVYYTKNSMKVPDRVNPIFLKRLAHFYLQNPLGRVTMAWQAENRSSLSIFGMAAVCKVYPEDVIEEMQLQQIPMTLCTVVKWPMVSFTPISPVPYDAIRDPETYPVGGQYYHNSYDNSAETRDFPNLAKVLEMYGGDKFNPDDEENISLAPEWGPRRDNVVTPAQYARLRKAYLLDYPELASA